MPSPYPITGTMNRKIIIQSSASSSKQDTGERILAWSTFKTVYAAVSESANGETLEGGKVTATTGTTFTIRYVSGVTAKMRILYNSEYYNITGISDIGRNRYLAIKTESLS